MRIDTGDTAWLLTSSALVLLMTPGLAFFYGGLVRRKNALATIMQSFIIIGVISVQWALWGYSVAFGPNIGNVFGVHGVGGTWGAIATGLFATIAVNTGGGNGLFYGNPSQLLIQCLAVLCSWIWAGGLTFVILKLLDASVGLRVPAEHELAGLDASIHGEPAYAVEI